MSINIANADLEFEITDPSPLSLEESLRRNPIIHQLQFLPILYANPGDIFGVTDLPTTPIPSCHLLSNLPPLGHIESWAPSRCIAQFAKERGITYDMPNWDIVKTVNSKAFSFQHSPPLPGAELIHSFDELHKWIKLTEGPKVLKSCFGLSGRGHLFLPSDKLEAFASKEFSASRPLIAEPWVERRLDFSTQWFISKHKDIEYLGSTLLQSDARGKYHGNIVGSEHLYFPYLHAHKIHAQKALHTMASLGFFGNVGIDAMVWGDNILHPIVEINARKTMGWISLQIGKRLFPNQTITVSYVTESSRPPLLPQGIIKPSGQVMKFHRNLYVDV